MCFNLKYFYTYMHACEATFVYVCMYDKASLLNLD